MKNNKGFTLVELIAVIGLLLLIATVTVPSVIGIQNNNKNKNYNRIQETIITASETYYHNYVDLSEDGKCYIELQDLANKNLIKIPVINPKTNEEISLSTSIVITRETNLETITINYEIIDSSGINECQIKSDMDDLNPDGGESSSSYKDPSGANSPILAEGMIPVIFDENTGTYIKASTDSIWYRNDAGETTNPDDLWYDYGNQKWANAVTVMDIEYDHYLFSDNSGNSLTCGAYYKNAKPGTKIKKECIASEWVWIPRFKYKIPKNIGSSSSVSSPPLIEIKFESGTNSTGVDATTYKNGITTSGTNTNFYTHPAFRDGSSVYKTEPYDLGGWYKELTGFWVSKFEITSFKSSYYTSDTCKNVKTCFEYSLKFAGGTMDSSTGDVTFAANEDNVYELNTTTDTTNTHMMKNTEWGAVAILSQSQYGKMGNSGYEGANKEIYLSNKTTTYDNNFYSTGSPNGSTSNYYYNDRNKNGNKRVKNAGTGASTTGTLYGVYGMNGGMYTYTMGKYKNASGNSGFTVLPSKWYYDNYTGTDAKEISKLGDATWETMNWYSDSVEFISTTTPWFIRGGYHNAGSTSGIFASKLGIGNESENISFRVVLIP